MTMAEIIIFLVILGIVALSSYLNDNKSGRTYSSTDSSFRTLKGKNVWLKTDPKRALHLIQSTDSNFRLDVFIAKFSKAFYAIQNAWQAQELTPIRPFVSDRIYERFTLQIQEQRDLGYRDKIDYMKIESAELIESDTNSAFDVITIKVIATMTDYRVSITDGSTVSGKSSPQSFTEFWSFVRRKGVSTKSDAQGLLEGFCPQCGDQIILNQSGQCQSCGAISRNGEYDWVLSEITQASVWQPKNPSDVDVYNWYAQNHDPGFNIQHLEDRASVMFWRKAMADRTGNVAPLAKMARNEFCEKYQRKMDDRISNNGIYEGNCSVGAVDLMGFVLEKDHDLALVKIQFSSHDFQNFRDLGNWSQSRRVMVLYRKKGVKSDLKTAVSSTCCPCCGAPETDLAAHACEFCGEVLNTGDHDWVLDGYLTEHQAYSSGLIGRIRKTRDDVGEIVVQEKYQNAVVTPAVGASASRIDGVSWLVMAAMQDGVLDNVEQEFLTEFAAKSGIRKSLINDMLKSAKEGKLQYAIPENRQVAKQWLGDLAQFALADDVITDEEMILLNQLGKSSGFLAPDVKLIVARRRSEIYRQSRRMRPDPNQN